MSFDHLVHYLLSLGPPVLMPFLITGLGLLFRQSFGKSARAGLTVGAGFIAIGLVVGLLVNVVGPKAMAFAEVLGLKLDILDVGWPMGAAVSFASPIAAALIPIILALNVVLVLLKVTRTIDVDLWNYWHFIYTGALIHAATGSTAFGIVGACICATIIFKLADWTAPIVEKHFGLPGISLPHTETINWAPLMFGLERIWKHVPFLRDAGSGASDATGVRKRIGVLGEPLVMGALLGLLLGVLGAIPLFRAHKYGEWFKEIATLSVTMSAVLVVLPKVVAILMEGLIPISEGAREYLQKRFPGRDLLIGLDAAVVIGHPANMAIALLCVPIALLLAVILPGNRMLPFGDLAALPFYILWGVAAARGNMVRGLLNAIVVLVCILWIGTSLGPLTTELAKNAGFDPAGVNAGVAAEAHHYTEWSGVALGSHVVPWMVLQLFRPGARWIGLVTLSGFFAIWWWVRRDVLASAAAPPSATDEPNVSAEKEDGGAA